MSILTRFGLDKTFSHGVHPPEYKSLTEHRPIRRLPFADEMIIPLSQHTGAPARPIVRGGQEVVRSEPIAEPGGFVSVPMHAPATGRITRIALARDVRGGMSPALFLQLYPGEGQEILYGAPVDVDGMSNPEIVKAVQRTGVVGLGGAAFPTHVKLAVPEGKTIDTVIVNGCECEPYLTTDHRLMVEHPEDVYEGIRVVQRAYQAARVVVGIENNKPDAVDAMRLAKPDGEPIEVESIETKYPQGAEKMLIKSLLDREVPSGGLPMDVGAAVFNVATLAQIGELLPMQRGLIERVITVTGPAVGNPGNYLVALGTPIRFILEQCRYRGEDASVVILGGPMMGVTVPSLDIPITKGVTSILVLDKAEVQKRNRAEYPCIRCGSCLDACPMHLNPSRLGQLARKREFDTMANAFNLMDCFECGSCSYVCPSNIPLVQRFRVAKSIIRERKAAS